MGKFHYKILADFLLMLHFLWIALLIGGTIYIIEHQWYIPYHLTIVTGTLLFNLLLGGCPITWWEEKYRKKYDPNTYYYPNSFAATYAKKLFRVDVTPGQVNLVLTLTKITSYSISVLVLTKLI